MATVRNAKGSKLPPRTRRAAGEVWQSPAVQSKGYPRPAVADRPAQSTGISWHRVQRTGALALLVLAPAALFLRCAADPEVPFLFRDANAPWITPAVRVSADLQQWGREEIPLARFASRFPWRASGAAVELRLRALRSFDVELNGSPVAAGDGSSWTRETRVDLSPWLRPGENELVVAVRNARGPPLLSVRMSGLDAEQLPADWTVELDGVPARVAIADDTRINPESLAVESPLEALASRRDAAILLFLAGGCGFLMIRRFGIPAEAPAPLLLLGLSGAVWLALFATKIARIPLEIGFDARHHLVYVEMLRSNGAVPLATDGWSTFHPPLFYLAALAAGDSRLVLKLLPWLAGFLSVVVTWLLARRLLPDDPRGIALAILFAAVLPMNLYSSAYFSNESLHTLLASASLLAAVDLLLSTRSGAARTALLGTLLGLAALTKFTVVLVVPVALFFLVVKWLGVERAGAARVATLSLAFALPLLAIAGWFYARNAIVYGDPLMANWGGMPGPGRTWWQQPGFHTASYYATFGEALRHPYLSGFRSFWDSVYSTFWGDGFVAGRVRAADRHGFWSYEFMSLGYLLALPATLLLAGGALLAVRAALADADAHRRAAFSFLVTCSWAVGLGFIYLTLRLPFFAQAKATYTLLLVGPLAVFFAMGARWCDSALSRRASTPARFVFWGWMLAWAGTLHLAFAA